jgi:hypothetical protein
VSRSHFVNANLVDTWNTSWSNSVSNDSGAGTLLSLVQYQGLKYPPWTWDELAFPKINLTAASGDSDIVSFSTDSPASPEYMTVPALRASLNWAVLTGEDVKIENYFGPSSHPGTLITGV